MEDIKNIMVGTVKPRRTPIGWIKEGIQTLAHLGGLAIKPYPEPSGLEQHLKDLFRIFGINCVLDIGAHTGAYYRMLRNLGYENRIVSFEPVSDSFAKLKALAEGDPHWSGINIGLSDCDQERGINVYSSSDFNSLHKLEDEVKKNYRVAGEAPRKEVIRLRRLDSAIFECVPNLNEARIFMKMDTQGHDLTVFRGAAGVMDCIVALQSEMAGIPIYEGIPGMEAVMPVYFSNGFVPSFFGAVNTFSSTLATPEWDVVFIRKPEQLAPE
jgi:FkbM family methyltransferase